MKMLLNFFISAGAIYLLLCLYLFFMQDSMIFFNAKADKTSYQRWKNQEYTVQSADNTLHGWSFENPHIHNNSALIYFGGNAEDVIYNLDDASRYHIHKLFFTNYAGYGNSTGTPSENTLYTDALTIFDQLVQQHRLDPATTFVMGRSLGSAVASHVASQRNTAGVILVTPFTNMPDLAVNFYKIFPVRWLLKYRFDTQQQIQQTQAPVLIIAAANDEFMPAAHITALQTAARHAATPVIIPNSGHNTLHLSPQYFDAINQFINGTLTVQPATKIIQQ